MDIIQPKPQSIKYRDLIQDIEKGYIKIPQFQRDFVWDIDKTSELLDSVLKGYPIGTFIIWQTKDRINNIKNIGEEPLPDTPEGTEVQYILDGQQRITSLFAAYKGVTVKVSRKNKPINFNDVVVNLDASIENSGEQIVTPRSSTGKCISLYEVLHITYTKAKNLPPHITEEDKDKIDSYSRAFNNYDFSTVNLRKDDIDSAIDVFTRINTGGQTLTLFEIMSAKTYDEQKHFDMQKNWKEFLEQLNESHFDDISNSNISSANVLNLLSLVISKSKECKRSVILGLDKLDIINNWDLAISALNESIDYFRNNLRIPVSRLLPYDALLVPFSYFFFYNKNLQPGAVQHLYLKEFFWRMSLSHRYSTSSETRLGQDVRRIDKILKNERPDYSDITIELNEAKDLANTSFSTSDSFCKAILCLLASLEPNDLLDNSKVRLDNSWLKVSNSKNFHHFFPRKYLEKNNIENSNSIVNITLVSDKLNKRLIRARAPSDYIGEFSEKNESLQSTLQTHLIDDIAEFGILNNQYKVFLEQRSKRIFDELKQKLNLKRKNIKNIVDAEGIIQQGESDTTEFKSTLRYDIERHCVNRSLEDSVVKTIAAFLNAEGGNLFIGVADNGGVAGLDLDMQSLRKKPTIDGFDLHLNSLLREQFGSLLITNLKISFPHIENKEVCWIKIAKANEPVFVSFQGKDKFFVRIGSSSRALEPSEQSKYERTHWK